MKLVFKIVLFISLFTFSSFVSGQTYNASVGARLGTIFSGTYKAFVSEVTAFEAIAGFENVAGESYLLAGGFLEIHNPLSVNGSELSWYYGAGGYIALGEVTGIVPSGIIGLEYVLDDSPVNLFIDAIPSIFIGGGSTFQLNGAIGARYILN